MMLLPYKIKLFISLGIVFFINIMLSSCAKRFPASVQEISANVYKIQARGNFAATQKELQDKITIKANELCGELQFSYQSLLNLTVKTSKINVDNLPVEEPYIEVNRIVACSNPYK